MRLVCHIGDLRDENENELLFDIVQGATFSEEYNETLDSGNIIIVSKERQLNIKPYDDVIIFDKDVQPTYIGWSSTLTEIYKGQDGRGFYRHLLVNNFSEEIIYQGDTSNINSASFKYKISLMSETKKLEKIIVPRLSITQPIKNENKKFIRTYLENFLNLYNPKIKRGTVDGWVYESKYSYAWTGEDNLSIFNSIWSPEFTLGESTFKELLTELFQVADRIPYVKDDVIHALDISKTKGNFDTTKGQINFPLRSMTSEDYCTNLRTTYSDALPQEYSGHSVECIGFRNSEQSVLTLDNMRLELNFPIYKINHVYMHYYKNAVVTIKNTNTNTTTTDENFPVLITQDITNLVRMSNEPLSKDWEEFENNPIGSIDDAAKFDFSTVRYSQCSKYITGWGDKYQYPFGDWMDSQTRTHIENIVRIVDNLNPYGIMNKYSLRNQIEEKVLKEHGSYYTFESFSIPNTPLKERTIDAIIKNFFGTSFSYGYGYNATDILKDMFFTIDYQPFYNGAVVHSKKFGEVNENLTSIDNPNNSLCLIERDGIAQREKLERFGVSTLQLNARYTDINDLQDVGTVYNSIYSNDGLNQNVIIYHREYSIFDNVINCTYFGSQDYVLKNYYTSVYAKYRVYNLMSYNESVRRAENQKYYIYLSLSGETPNDIISGLSINRPTGNLWLSGILPTIRNGVDSRNYKLNISYFYVPYYMIWDGATRTFKKSSEGGYFSTDLSTFSTDNSLIFNTSMIDNITGGTYWEKPNVKIDWNDNTRNDIRGTTQNQYYVANYEDGTLYQIGFGFAHKESLGFGALTNMTLGQIDYDMIKQRPLFFPIEMVTATNHISVNKEFYKDNKELIDFSLQFEYITGDNIFISAWFGRLNDLVTNFYKQKDLSSPIGTVQNSSSNVYIGITYEKASRNLFAPSISKSINYESDDVERLYSDSNLNLNGVGFGYGDAANSGEDGFYYITEEFYRKISGKNLIANNGFTFSNPVLIFGVNKERYDLDNLQPNYQFEINYSKCNFTITSDSVDEHIGNYNPYYINENQEYITELKIDVNKVVITKGETGKDDFKGESYDTVDVTPVSFNVTFYYYNQVESNAPINQKWNDMIPYWNNNMGCFIIDRVDGSLLDNLNFLSNYYYQTLTINIDDDFEPFEYNSNLSVKEEYLKKILKKGQEIDPSLSGIVLQYECNCKAIDNDDSIIDERNLVFLSYYSDSWSGFNFKPQLFSNMESYAINYVSSLISISYSSTETTFSKKTDCIQYPNSSYQLEIDGGSNINRIASEPEFTRVKVNHYYNEANLKNYAIVNISYKTNVGATGSNIIKKIPLHKDTNNYDGYYVFEGAIRFFRDGYRNFNPLQLDLKSDLRNNGGHTIEANFSLADYFDLSDSEVWKKVGTTIDEAASEDNLRTYTTHYDYSQMMLDSMKAGITKDLTPSLVPNGSILSNNTKFSILGEGSYTIDSISNPLATDYNLIEGYSFQNLYYCVSDETIDGLYKYKKHYLNQHIKDISNYVTINANENGITISIPSLPSDFQNFNKSFSVFYRSNEKLGNWEIEVSEGNVPSPSSINGYMDDTNLHFVFGTNGNVTSGRTISINSTLLQSRDRRVYNDANVKEGNLDNN